MELLATLATNDNYYVHAESHAATGGTTVEAILDKRPERRKEHSHECHCSHWTEPQAQGNYRCYQCRGQQDTQGTIPQVRRPEFEFNTDDMPRYWWDNKPVKTLLLAAMSSAFRRGAVLYRFGHVTEKEITDPELKKAIKASSARKLITPASTKCSTASCRTRA